MTNNRKLKIILNLIGLSGILAIIALLIFVVHYTAVNSRNTEDITNYALGSITFDSEEIIFDGSQPLDLMAGVKVDDGNGNDITSNTNAIITSDGTQNRKIVRYTCFDAQGHTLTATRTLVMVDYVGPTLDIAQPLTLDAAKLDNLIANMQSDSQLEAYDGFGKNITSEVTCQREFISAGLYKMTFQVINDYNDEKTVTRTVRINGKVDDPTIELYSNSVSVPMGRKFDPMNFVVSQSPAVGKIDIDSSVNPMIPGDYRVIYTAYSNDRSAKSTKIMQVTVTGETND